ncbi:hypothetical protein JR338_09255 [Chloroflexota bacterium]|nr:hypothetical protein JR338_09255 [Chloroflexota bacterium]
MKRKSLISVVGILLIMFLVACSGNSQEEASTEADGDGEPQSVVSNKPNDELMDVSQLIVGTLMLAETDYPITPEQAETLLPLWQIYQTMVDEDTTASQELDAVIKQIQRALSDEQLTEISSIEFDDPVEMMELLGIEPNLMTGPQSVDDLPEDIMDQLGSGGVIVIDGGLIGSGEMPSGGFSGSLDSGELGDIGELDPEQFEKLQGQAGDLDSIQIRMFLPALIEYLEEVAAS